MPHVKGEWARKRMTLKLEPWQKFILSTLFGWKRAKDGLRRFREAYIEVPRKNGKSCFVAPMGLYMLVADGEEAIQIVPVDDVRQTQDAVRRGILRHEKEVARRL